MQVLEGRRRIFGERHRKTIDTLHALATLYANQGKYAEAEKTYRELLATQRAVEEHADVANTLVGMATSLRSQDKVAEAESLYRKALALPA